MGSQVSRGTGTFIPSGTQTTKGTDLKNPTTLGVKSWRKSLTEVPLMTPMTSKLVRSKSLNSHTEASSTQNQKLCVQGEVLLGLGINPLFDREGFLIYNRTTNWLKCYTCGNNYYQQ